ncbi:hypothetical protein DKX38_007612 [Salix brachista]|uniref:Uncharacterized protein n=1 Tax=Salix brachista TaxID=2182728 RepID=A0A5N5MQK2_9ROSI|nr:hypothetical protein DKX38_007612 [Salix brachista]
MGTKGTLYFSRARGWGLGTSFTFSKVAVFFGAASRLICSLELCLSRSLWRRLR